MRWRLRLRKNLTPLERDLGWAAAAILLAAAVFALAVLAMFLSEMFGCDPAAPLWRQISCLAG